MNLSKCVRAKHSLLYDNRIVLRNCIPIEGGKIEYAAAYRIKNKFGVKEGYMIVFGEGETVGEVPGDGIGMIASTMGE